MHIDFSPYDSHDVLGWNDITALLRWAETISKTPFIRQITSNQRAEMHSSFTVCIIHFSTGKVTSLVTFMNFENMLKL